MRRMDFLRKVFILNQDRYQCKKLNSYKRLEQNIGQLDQIDSVILQMIHSIPEEIEKLNYRYYFVNFNTQYFDALYLHCLIMMAITFPFAIIFYPFLIIVIPLLYCLICLICNFILTVFEIKNLKKTLQKIYKNIQMKL